MRALFNIMCQWHLEDRSAEISPHLSRTGPDYSVFKLMNYLGLLQNNCAFSRMVPEQGKVAHKNQQGCRDR